MTDLFFGIDLGTSSVKVLAADGVSPPVRFRCGYASDDPAGWLDAVRKAVRKTLLSVDRTRLRGIGLSSQVGTYIADGKTVLPWRSGVGAAELAELRERYSPADFRREIDMAHPDIYSYPLPRLLYLKRQRPALRQVCQPKELVCELLTGVRATDPYSWRGLTGGTPARYSDFFLRELGISPDVLPPLRGVFEPVGGICGRFAEATGLPIGLPVYTGMNDFFCALLGMGLQPGDLFDITGSSEHVGVLQSAPVDQTPLVAGPFFDSFVHYGVTASSGASLTFSARAFEPNDSRLRAADHLPHRPPIFLPYVNGERAPIFDPDARGVFFGLTGDASRQDLAYSVLEGCAFSVRHIYDTLGAPPCDCVRVSGGTAQHPLLGSLKATLLGTPVRPMTEPDASALGAVIVAATGHSGRPWREVAARFIDTDEAFLPDETLKEPLLRRYQIYRNLYPALRDSFAAFQAL